MQIYRQTSWSLRDPVATSTPRLDEELFRRNHTLTPAEIGAIRAGQGPNIQFHPLLRNLRFARHSAYEDILVNWPNLSQEDWFDEARNRRPLCSIAAAEQENGLSIPVNYIKFDTGHYPKWHPLDAQSVGGDHPHHVEGDNGAPITVAALIKAFLQATEPDNEDEELEIELESAENMPRFRLWSVGHLSSTGRLEVRGADWDEFVNIDETDREPDR